MICANYVKESENRCARCTASCDRQGDPTPELVGGGLIRSAGGWSAVKAMRRAQAHMKSDEPILGDGEFTQLVLDEAKERLEERYRLQAQGYDLEK